MNIGIVCYASVGGSGIVATRAWSEDTKGEQEGGPAHHGHPAATRKPETEKGPQMNADERRGAQACGRDHM